MFTDETEMDRMAGEALRVSKWTAIMAAVGVVFNALYHIVMVWGVIKTVTWLTNSG